MKASKTPDCKILHLIQTSGLGGAENMFLHLVQNTEAKYKTIVGLLQTGWLYHQLKENGIDVRIIPSGGSFDLKLLAGMVTLIRQERIQLIHSHLFDMNFYSSLAGLITRIPHISTEHGDVHHPSKNWSNRTKIKAKTIFALSNRVVFVSQFTKEQMLKIVRNEKQKSEVIYNGIPLEKYDMPIDLRSKKQEIGIRRDEFVVGNVANLYPVKGQTFLLRAAKKILNEAPNTKFIIIGTGELEGALKTEAINLGIANKVKFLGFRQDVTQLLKTMDIFVLPSLSEGLPMSLIEAMASRVPVVATNVGGIPEVITKGENGLLVPPGRPESLASQVINLLKNRETVQRIAEGAYSTVKHNFDLRLMIKRYEKLYSITRKRRTQEAG